MSDRINTLDDIMALFPPKLRQKIRGGFNLICPAHTDRNPSLSVMLRDGKILLKCMAGCQTEAVVKA